jgi:hypothetical protein
MYFLLIVSTESILNCASVEIYEDHNLRYLKSTSFVPLSSYLAIKHEADTAYTETPAAYIEEVAFKSPVVKLNSCFLKALSFKSGDMSLPKQGLMPVTYDTTCSN